MRHNYRTPALVLARYPYGEASASLMLLTRELGLVRARAQSVRRPGAKLAATLATWNEFDAVLVAGKEGWRISGAVLSYEWFTAIPRAERTRATRVATLLLRLVHGEAPDPRIFDAFKSFLEALRDCPAALHDAAECLAALKLLSLLGLDAGDIPESLDDIQADRAGFVKRINRGITASGL